MTISSVTPDWSRETRSPFRWDPSRALIASIRNYQAQAAKRSMLGAWLNKYVALKHRFWSVITGADIPVTCHIGGGLLMPHPNGIVIHPDAVLGVNCLVFQQVTIGQRNGGVPIIGGHVDIGAGAKILGSVTIGNHAIIGANAVVLEDVPENATAVGVPARIVGSRHTGNH
jgi:serine O-acetyltransferase